MRNIFYIFILILLFESCAGGKQAADSPYRRKPIVEVSEGELAVDAALIDAAAQQITGRTEEAVAQYQKILRDSATYSPAHYELGRIFLAVGWLDSALYHTRQACRLDADNVWYQLMLARVYERRNDTKNLVATWEGIVKANPDKVDFYYSLANAYLMAGNVQGSIDVLDRLEKRYGVTEEVSLHKQKLWMAVNKPDKARKELERLAEALPNESSYNAILAESYMAEKNYDKALYYYNRILENDPNDENVSIALASCYLAMGNLPQTYASLRKSLQNRNIDCQHRLTFLAEFMRDQRFFASYGRACFLMADTLVGMCGDEGGYHLIYGQMLAAQERYAEAAKQFVAHLGQDKGEYAAWEALLECESRCPECSQSLMDHALEASELFPLHLRPYLVLANGYLEQGNCTDAKKYIGRGMMISPLDPELKELNQRIATQCNEENE